MDPPVCMHIRKALNSSQTVHDGGAVARGTRPAALRRPRYPISTCSGGAEAQIIALQAWGEVGVARSHRLQEHVGVEQRRAAGRRLAAAEPVGATTAMPTGCGARASTYIASGLHMVRRVAVNIFKGSLSLPQD
jgi:hypothetical protein